MIGPRQDRIVNPDWLGPRQDKILDSDWLGPKQDRILASDWLRTKSIASWSNLLNFITMECVTFFWVRKNIEFKKKIYLINLTFVDVLCGSYNQ